MRDALGDDSGGGGGGGGGGSDSLLAAGIELSMGNDALPEPIE